MKDKNKTLIVALLVILFIVELFFFAYQLGFSNAAIKNI
jgi:hypothetical protein